MLLIYTSHITTRIQYIIDTLFTGHASLTTDQNTFAAYKDAKINYSLQRVSNDEFWIEPYGLLSENSINHQSIKCFEWHSLKAFFKTRGDIPFDIFSAAFYLVTRYEEYLPHSVDEYGRYAHTNSIAFKENFIHLPLINLWIKELNRLLQIKFPSLVIHDSTFKFLPTYDIDIAYSYKYKGLLRNTLGLCKDVARLRFDAVTERIKTLINKQPDPYDVFGWLDELHNKLNIKPIYFFLLAEQSKLYDKNISPHTPAMKALVLKHAKTYTAGIHPSWQSGDDITILKREIDLLKQIKGDEVLLSRQHYIRMNLPETYYRLIANGIKEDYSMGYGSINGFRASVCVPFYWYDLKNEEVTNLLIRPFCYMEANSYFEERITATETAAELQQYVDIVKSVNGEMITIFHNHFLTKQQQWIEWRQLYENYLYKNSKA